MNILQSNPISQRPKLHYRTYKSTCDISIDVFIKSYIYKTNSIYFPPMVNKYLNSIGNIIDSILIDINIIVYVYAENAF